MDLLIQPNTWTCLPTSLAMLLSNELNTEVTLKDIFDTAKSSKLDDFDKIKVYLTARDNTRDNSVESPVVTENDKSRSALFQSIEV